MNNRDEMFKHQEILTPADENDEGNEHGALISQSSHESACMKFLRVPSVLNQKIFSDEIVTYFQIIFIEDVHISQIVEHHNR